LANRPSTPDFADRVVSWRDPMRHPDPGFEAERIGGIAIAEFGRQGIPWRTGIGTTGVLRRTRAGRPDKAVAICTGTDVPPIQEAGGCPFASAHERLAKVLSHDNHTTILPGIAAVSKQVVP
jgi:metal-dependent amidase/aminoacylase/carboxypeptidase family protein